MNSIPASEIVQVNPSVIQAGGNPLSLSSVFLTNDTSIPIGEVTPFATQLAVANWFGADSTEATLAAVYFLGWDNSTIKPGNLFFAQYPVEDVAAYVRGGSISGLTLDDIKLMSGTLIVTMDGTGYTSSTINLNTATSFSNAATIIQDAFTGGPDWSYDSQRAAFVATSSTTGSTSTIGYVSGTMAAGLYLTEATGATLSQGASAAVTPATAAYLNGGDLSGVSLVDFKAISGELTLIVDGYLKTSSTLDFSGVSAVSDGAAIIEAAFSGTPLTCAWDSTNSRFVLTSATTGAGSSIGFCTGTASAALMFTSDTGAQIFQGQAAQTNPAATMNNITVVTQDWASFMTMWEPNTAGKTAFADWVNAQNNRYVYVAWDSDVTAESASATTSFGYLMQDGNYNGVWVEYPVADKAAFICGVIASINFSDINGRITVAFKQQSGLTVDVTDPTVAQNLIDNGYNFYGAYATANQRFVFEYPGQIAGMWNWLDSYVNQIYLTSQLQLAFMVLLTNVNSIPYNARGYALIEATALDPINEAVRFGSIVPGVPLSNQQKAEVTGQAGGIDISGALESQGWYLQILPATAQTRALRESPNIKLWYMDGQSIQKITMASINIQ